MNFWAPQLCLLHFACLHPLDFAHDCTDKRFFSLSSVSLGGICKPQSLSINIKPSYPSYNNIHPINQTIKIILNLKNSEKRFPAFIFLPQLTSTITLKQLNLFVFSWISQTSPGVFTVAHFPKMLVWGDFSTLLLNYKKLRMQFLNPKRSSQSCVDSKNQTEWSLVLRASAQPLIHHILHLHVIASEFQGTLPFSLCSIPTLSPSQMCNILLPLAARKVPGAPFKQRSPSPFSWAPIILHFAHTAAIRILNYPVCSSLVL